MLTPHDTAEYLDAGMGAEARRYFGGAAERMSACSDGPLYLSRCAYWPKRRVNVHSLPVNAQGLEKARDSSEGSGILLLRDI